MTASETFSKKNTNRSIEETFAEAVRRIEALQQMKVPIAEVSVMAAFGCNYEGDVAPEHVVAPHRPDDGHRRRPRHPDQADPARRLDGLGQSDVDAPDGRHGAGPLARAAHQPAPARHARPRPRQRVRGDGDGRGRFRFRGAGLGGCPYAGFKDAPGNIATEDLVHMCNEIGVETGSTSSGCSTSRARPRRSSAIRCRAR